MRWLRQAEEQRQKHDPGKEPHRLQKKRAVLYGLRLLEGTELALFNQI